MTVAELIAELAKMPPDAEVECDTDIGWQSVISVRIDPKHASIVQLEIDC